MTNTKNDDIHALETNVENKYIEDGLNNKDSSVQLEGGDNEDCLPFIQEKIPYEDNDKSRDKEIESPEIDIENPTTEKIIKEINANEKGGDKVDINFEEVKKTDSIIEKNKI